MIRRLITQAIKDEAMYNAKILTERNKSMPNKFGVNDTPETRYLGQLGDLTFKSWLIEHKVHFFTWGIIEHNIDEDYDFKLKSSNKLIDVKTRLIKHNMNPNLPMLIEVHQTTKFMDYYIDIQLFEDDDNRADINGYILRSDVINKYESIQTENMPARAYPVKIGDLCDIRDLIYKETGKLIGGMMGFMNIDLSTLPKNQGKVKNLALMDYTSDYMLSLPNKPKVSQTLMDY